jgi:transcriptional regulator with XRE-family HTH domain
MRKTQLDLMVPIPVRRAVHKLGQDIRDARLRRRISTAVMAERASISRTTLNKIEKGDPGVSLGNYANVLFVLGMAERLGDLADVKMDTVGLELDEERLPQRIRKPRSPKSERKSGGKSPQSGQKSKA